MKNKKLIAALFFSLLSFLHLKTFAQEANTDVKAVDFAKDNKIGDLLKADDKMIAVIVVIAVILVGLFSYLWRLDKKIDNLNK